MNEKQSKRKRFFLYNNSDLCQPVKVEVLNVINCKVWVDIFPPMCESGGCESTRFLLPCRKGAAAGVGESGERSFCTFVA